MEEYTDYDEGHELFQSLGVVVEDCDIAKLGAVAIRSRRSSSGCLFFRREFFLPLTGTSEKSIVEIFEGTS